MALEFTNIPDRQGPAVYLLGNRMIETELQTLGQAVDSATAHDTQVVYLDIDSGDGAQVAELYAISRDNLPVVMIVQDDDTLYHSWSGQDLPSVDMIVYHINQITGTLST